MNLADDLSMALDPCRLFERVVGGPPSPFQREILLGTEPRVLACCGRGTGKSASTAIAAAHRILYVPKSLVIVGSPSENISAELGRKIFAAVRAVDPNSISAMNQTRVELTNGSRCVCLPAGEKTRSLHGCELLIIDEASLCAPEQFSVLFPFQSTAKNPRCIILGTPKGRIGKFWEFFSGGNFKVIKVRSDEVGRISKEHLSSQLALLGPHEFAQEYLAEFQDATTAVFSSELIARAHRGGAMWDV